MNEVDWLTTTDPAAMLAYLEGQVSDRKLRLFACACVRRYWRHLRFASAREAVETAERYAEGQATDAELEQARQQAEMAAMDPGMFSAYVYFAATATAMEQALEAARNACESIRQHAVREAAYEVAPGENEAQVNAGASLAERRALCELVREVFGNPFRPVKVDLSWLSIDGGSGGAVLHAVDEEDRFEELPYLADALTDAGCTEEALLRHLRTPSGHVRGCWAVDLLLERS
jgi:hypothetical protein